ncbi:hypothetical protein SAMN05216338_101839 [Bradyrhizobium sp. Rc2d]|nr:hypothetical protein SAMN05216338_101839 [Bradyrhizobium sp. Rc2d]
MTSATTGTWNEARGPALVERVGRAIGEDGWLNPKT